MLSGDRAGRRARRRWWEGPLLLAGLLCALEVGARLVTDAGEFGRFGQRVGPGIDTGARAFNDCLVPDPDLFWRFAPDRSLPEEGDGPFFGLVSNHEGLRGPPVRERSEGQWRILVLGDSCAYGFGLSAGDAWPARLQARLVAAGVDAEVLDAGVPGYSSLQGRVLAERLVPRYRPDLVLVAFGWNDNSVWDGLTDAQQFEAANQGGLAGWLAHSRAWLLLRKLALSARRALRGPAERLVRVPPPQFSANLAAIAGTCRRAGAGVRIVIWPFRSQVLDPAQALTDYQLRMLDSGLPVTDLVADFRRAADPSLFLDAGHASAAGCERVAAAVARDLLAARR